MFASSTYYRQTHTHHGYDVSFSLANLRCGAWYIDPQITRVDCWAYFKSTDGHDGQWQFSLRRSAQAISLLELRPERKCNSFRSNLQLLNVIISHGGVILVDSTRRGKVNQLLFFDGFCYSYVQILLKKSQMHHVLCPSMCLRGSRMHCLKQFLHGAP